VFCPAAFGQHTVTLIMKFKQIILSSVFWRGLYFVTVLLLNIIVSRYFQAKGSGWIYYITNYFSFILLIASLSLESGMTFFASKNGIRENKLATFSLLWSAIVSMVIVILLFLYYKHPEQALTRNQFVFFAVTYTTGILLTTFFCALFYAQQDYAVPNILLTITNLLLIFSIPVALHFGKEQYILGYFLKLYFFNYLLQGILLSIAYLKKNKIFRNWALPGLPELTLLFRYSLFALLTNLVFFLLYRIDYWFVKNMCPVCNEADLGNYIQVSKLGQMFLLLPGILASAIFPHTAAGFREQVNNWLPSLVKGIFYIYLFIIIFFVLAGQWLFPWVYGETFDRMYLPFLFLVPGILSLSAISLLSAYNAGKNMVKTNVKGSVAGLAVIIAGDWFFIPKYGISAAAIVSSTGYLIYLVYLLYIFNKEYHIAAKYFFIPVAGDWQKLQKIFSPDEKN
jgi:O-antigen/teichoic acid export membrane protein